MPIEPNSARNVKPITLEMVERIAHNIYNTERWNGGVCPKCGERYELVLTKDDLKYYSCPICRMEITRY